MYKVVIPFVDLQDDELHRYEVGDVFPKDGKEVSDDRLKELSTTQNKRGVVLIVEEQKQEEKPVVKAKKERKKNA